MAKSEKVATPFTALRLTVPARVPAPGLAPITTVTRVVAVVTVLPAASSTVTCTAGVIGAPATVALGCTVNASLEGTAGVLDARQGALEGQRVDPARGCLVTTL